MNNNRNEQAKRAQMKDEIRQDFRIRKKELRRLQREEINQLKAARDEKILAVKNLDPAQLSVEKDLTDSLTWSKVDNSAILYPITTQESVSNVFRVSITLDEPIKQELLQEALEIVLPKFELFRQRLRQGIFWYYFEENEKLPQHVHMEHACPCRYISKNRNRGYLFRVTYYECRINLEVYHVLTDGMGAFNFLKELTYQYLRLKDKQLHRNEGDALQPDTSLNTEDAFLKHYSKKNLRPYRFKRALIPEGAKLPADTMGVVQGYVSVRKVREAAARYGATINEFIVAAVNWAIYQTYQKGYVPGLPIITCVPVNLRPVYDSDTTKNFFVNVQAVFAAEHANHTFSDVIEAVKASLREQMTKENLESVLSTNVSTERSWMIRTAPLIFKRPALKAAYHFSAKGTSVTVSNLGKITADAAYAPHIRHADVVLANSKGQHIKCSLVSYEDVMSVSFSSVLKSSAIQQAFFDLLTEEKIEAEEADNGLHEISLPKKENVSYPNAKRERKRLVLASDLYICSALAAESILAYFLGWHGARPDLVILIGLLMAYVFATFRISLRQNTSYSLKLTIQILMAMAVVIGIDLLTGAHNWAMNYVYPAEIIAVELITIGLILINRRSWQSFILMQILIILLSVVPFILYLPGFVTDLRVAYAAFAVALICFAFTIIIGGKKARDELMRRFHV